MKIEFEIDKLNKSNEKMAALSKELSKMGFSRLEVLIAFSMYAGQLSGLAYQSDHDPEATRKLGSNSFGVGYFRGKRIVDEAFGEVGHA